MPTASAHLQPTRLQSSDPESWSPIDSELITNGNCSVRRFFWHAYHRDEALCRHVKHLAGYCPTKFRGLDTRPNDCRLQSLKSYLLAVYLTKFDPHTAGFHFRLRNPGR